MPIAVPVPTDSLDALPEEAPGAELEILGGEAADGEAEHRRTTLYASADEPHLLALADEDASTAGAANSASSVEAPGVADGSEQTTDAASSPGTALIEALAPIAPAAVAVAAPNLTPMPLTKEVASAEIASASVSGTGAELVAGAPPIEPTPADLAAPETLATQAPALAPMSWPGSPAAPASISVRVASPIVVKPRTISWIGFLFALGLLALGGTVASWVAVRHISPGRVPSVFR